VVGYDVPPLIQPSKIGQPSVVRRVGSRHVQGKTESIEVLLDAIDIRVPVVKRATRRKLLLKKNLKRWPDFGRNDLGAFCIKIPAESLEVGGK
jgi:hypothetical protein